MPTEIPTLMDVRRILALQNHLLFTKSNALLLQLWKNSIQEEKTKNCFCSHAEIQIYIQKIKDETK